VKRVLITGGFGFVGRNFARRLLADDHYVFVIDDGSTCPIPPDWSDCSKRPDFMIADVREFRMPRLRIPALDFGTYDLIIHCAAVVGGRLKIEGDPLAVATDLAIDSDFFNALASSKTKAKIIYFSSSAVYPIEFQQRKVHCKLAESMVHFNGNKIGMPDQTYGFSKLAGEFLAKQAVEKYGLDCIIYRPFSGYGEDQSFDYPFPSIIKRVVGGDDPIRIWGTGDQVRDFIHIDDIVECVLQTMDMLKPGEVLNLGLGEGVSFYQLAMKAGSVLQSFTDKIDNYPWKGCYVPTMRFNFDISKPEGVFYRVADTWKMSQFYKPKVSLEEGIRRVASHLTKLGK